MGGKGDVAPLGGAAVMESDKPCVLGPLRCSKGTWLVILVILINLGLFADQNLLAPVLTPVAREFGFVERYPNGTVKMEYDEKLERDVEVVDTNKRDLYLGGYVTLVFFLLGGTVSLTVGYLTDVVNRRNTLAVVVVLGELSCALTIITTDYTGLLVTRAFTGIAIGGAIPLIFSLFGDLFSIEYRGKATAAAGVAQGAAGGLGQVLSGILAGDDGSNWRLAFVVVAIPSFILVVLLLLTVEEPPRGHKEEAFKDMGDDFVYDEKVTWEKVKELFKTPTVVLVFLQGIPASLPWGVMQTYFNDFLIEEKSIDRDASGLVVLGFGFGALIGSIIGGVASDKLVHRKKLIPIIMGCTTAVGAFPLLALVQAQPLALITYILIAMPSGVIIGVTGSAVRVILVNVTKPEVRGSSFAIFALFDDIGKGMGAFAVGLLINLSGSRTTGLTISLFGWVIGAFFHFAMARFIDNDYDKSQKHLEGLASKMATGRPVAMSDQI